MSRAPRKESRTETGRKGRIPLGHVAPKMARQASKGMVGRWLNDEAGRIEAARNAGYEHVMESTGIDGEEKPVSMVVGVAENGHPLKAYYMEIPEKFYREDQQAKQKEVDRVDDAILRGNIEGKVGDDGRYVPSQGINIRRE